MAMSILIMLVRGGQPSLVTRMMSFDAPCLLENDLAEMVISVVPSIEMVQFVNSGTEACMGVICLARAFTHREKIIKFEGCYHGHADPFLVKAGSGVATLGLPDSPGVPKGATYGTLTSPFNDISIVKNLFDANKGEIAAVILEPACSLWRVYKWDVWVFLHRRAGL